MYVLALANDAGTFRSAVAEDLAKRHWLATEFQEVEPFGERATRAPVAQELFDLEDELLVTGEPQFGTWHLYFGEETSTTEWLRGEARSPDRSEAQKLVLDALGRMLEQVDTPRLGGVSLQEDEDELTVTLAHEDETMPGLEVFVEKGQVVIDHGYGHLHFSEDKSPDWVDEALQFLYSALQGGVKVDVWEQDGELEKSMTFILLKGGETWGEYVGWARTPDPSFDGLPTETRILTFGQ